MGDYLNNFRQGDDKVIRIQYPVGIDITGWTFWFVMNDSLDAKTPIIQISHLAGDNVLDDPANGLVYITLPATDTGTMKDGSYYYSVKRVDTGGSIRTILPPIDDYRDMVKVIPSLKII